jgi:two-component system, NarL family, sensor histidine kinase UhpB
MKYSETTLIIEDNPGDSFLLKMQLEKAGWPVGNCHCETRLTGALKSLKNLNPVIIFLDLNLPDSNELETFLTIQSAVPNIPVIILSGINDNALSIQAVQAGAQDFLTKGEFDNKLLLKTILYSIERKKTQLRLEEVNKRFTYASKATNDPLWDWNMKTGEILWNEKVAVFGYSSMLPKNQLWKNANTSNQEKGTEEWNNFLKSNKEQWENHYSFRCGDGTYKNIYERGYILRDSNNIPYRMIGTMQDETEKILMQNKIKNDTQKKQNAILKTAIDNQESERSEISWELLENINQILVSANMKLGHTRFSKEVNLPAAIKESQHLILNALEGIKKITNGIDSSTIRILGIVAAIQNFIAQVIVLQNCKIVFNANINEQSISHSTALTIFRIIQDHLVNTIEHGGASDITINLKEHEETYLIDITDNGSGFKETEINKNIHLTNIFNRTISYNGKVIFNNSASNGFTISIQIPQQLNNDKRCI